MRSSVSRSHPLVLAVVAAASFSPAASVTSALDRMDLVLPGLNVSIICAGTGTSCSTGAPPNAIQWGGSGFNGVFFDSKGWWYTSRHTPRGLCGGGTMEDYSLIRAQTTSGAPELVLTVRAACNGSTREYSYPFGGQLDAINGVARFWVISAEEACSQTSCTQLTSMAELFEIRGLPDISEVVPEGPEGPEGPAGPPGPQGPPGPLLLPCPDADADAFRDCVTTPGCFPYGGACGDCDDTDPEINPRGSETKPGTNRSDRKDNDCNGVVDG